MGQSLRTVNCSGIDELGRLAIAVQKQVKGYLILWNRPELEYNDSRNGGEGPMRNDRHQITPTWEPETDNR